MPEQDEWNAHAVFMNMLAQEGFVVVGGPLDDGRILLIVHAESEEDIRTRLAHDPWSAMGLLRVSDIRLWQILLGELA